MQKSVPINYTTVTDHTDKKQWTLCNCKIPKNCELEKEKRGREVVLEKVEDCIK